MTFKQFPLLLAIFILASGFTPMNVSAPSLDWQKIELEKNITSKVSSSIAPVIRSGEYIVNVEVKIKNAPKLAAPSTGGNGDGNNAAKKTAEKEKEKKAPRIKFSDIDPKEAKGDFVVLSKLGLEAPLYMELEAPLKEEKREPAGAAPSEAKEWQKFMTQYIETFDLATYVESIQVDVKLDNYLGEDTKKTVETIINGLNLQFGKTKAEISISYIDMNELKKEIDKKKADTNRELYEWIGKIGAPIGIILAVILMGIFALLIFRKYAELQEKQMEMMKNQMMQKAPEAEKKKDEEEEKDKSAGMNGSMNSTLPEDEDGIERFKSMLKNNPVEACLMVKRWINEPTKIHQTVLKCLVKELSSDELSTIFNEISMEGRKTWKKYIGKAIRPEEMTAAKRFVGAQVVQEMIIPNSVTDAETVELLIKINPEESARFAEEQPQLAAILMNAMNAKFLSKMMDKLSDEKIQMLLTASFELTEEKISRMLGEFKAQISKYIKTDTISPFLEKLMELIPLSSPQRERMLYQGLAQSGHIKEMLDLARGFFPSELIFQIPDSMMKAMNQTYPREKKTELVLVLDESTRKKYMDIVAPNQKAKDMLELDLQKYEMNAQLKEKTLANKHVLMQEYVDHCRKQITANPNYLKELEPTLAKWLSSFEKKELHIVDGTNIAA